MSKTDEEVARAAWAGFATGCATGKWNDLLALMTDDVVVSLPSGPFRGENHGRERFRDFTRFVTTELQGQLTFEDPIRVSGANGTFVFEAWDEGTIAGRPVRNRIALSVDVADGLVREMREYLGMIGG